MAYEFKKLSNVDLVEQFQEDDTILVIQNDTVKQIPKDKIEGKSSIETTYFVTSDDYIRTGQDWDTGTEVTTENVVAAYEKGLVKLFVMYDGSLLGVGDIIGYQVYNNIKQPMYISPVTGGLAYLS